MRRRVFVPEVIQSSALDCGPAALKSLFAGFGLYLSYGRLREACQTDVDGTSIDTLESVAHDLGLDVEQRVMPADLLLLETSGCIPAIVVKRLPGGATHFVVLWRAHGPWLQIMDPAVGRVWVHRRPFLESLYDHEQEVPALAWTEWSRDAVFTAGLVRRMRELGVEPELAGDRARMDASLRLARTLVEAGALSHGSEAREFLEMCAANPAQIPPEYWTARAVLSEGDQIRLRGAVLLVAAGRRTEANLESLPPSLTAVLHEAPPRAWAPLWEALRANGRRSLALMTLGVLAAAAGTVVEALLFRGLIDLVRHLSLSGQRIAAPAIVAGLVATFLVIEWATTAGLLTMGRQLELRLRMRFLMQIPRLRDRYFQSRLISDMASRAHALQLLRQLPELAGQSARLTAGLFFTAAAVARFYPGAALPVTIAAIVSVGVPLLFQPMLIERELRSRELSGSLSRFYLDAFLGSRAIQAHGAERTLRAAHASQLAQWAEAGLRQHALIARAEAAQLALSMACVLWLGYQQAFRTQAAASLLLLIYWAISIPSIGRQLASIIWSLPALRNTSIRLLELLGSPVEEIEETPFETIPQGVAVNLRDVTVVASGRTVLDRIHVHIEQGEHVAIVGPSGAGKSSLVGLLLGWHQAAQGSVWVEGAPLDARRLAQLRRETVWIDPQVHLFRSTLYENLCYGNGEDSGARIPEAVKDAGLVGALHRLPDGLQASLGEGGALVSGGEGQRVRIGRGLARPDVRLAILDELARGLPREERQRLLLHARRTFAGATLIAISHDVGDTLDFDRVLVMENGRIAEQGQPRKLAETPGSRFRGMIEEERLVQHSMWSNPKWRRVRMTRGVLQEAVLEHEWTPA